MSVDPQTSRVATFLTFWSTPAMMRRSSRALNIAVCAGVAAAFATPLEAQRKDAQEFTKQGLLIVNFRPAAGADLKLGRRAADAVRSRMGRLVNKREVEVIDGGEIAWRLE